MRQMKIYAFLLVGALSLHAAEPLPLRGVARCAMVEDMQGVEQVQGGGDPLRVAIHRVVIRRSQQVEPGLRQRCGEAVRRIEIGEGGISVDIRPATLLLAGKDGLQVADQEVILVQVRLDLLEDRAEIEGIGVVPVGFLHLVIMHHQVTHRTDTKPTKRLVLHQYGSVRHDGVDAKGIRLLVNRSL